MSSQNPVCKINYQQIEEEIIKLTEEGKEMG